MAGDLGLWYLKELLTAERTASGQVTSRAQSTLTATIAVAALVVSTSTLVITKLRPALDSSCLTTVLYVGGFALVGVAVLAAAAACAPRNVDVTSADGIQELLDHYSLTPSGDAATDADSEVVEAALEDLRSQRSANGTTALWTVIAQGVLVVGVTLLAAAFVSIL